MAHFALLRANQAAWFGTITPAEIWALDSGRFKSINGDEGGVWAPSAQIEIGGLGLKFSGPLEFGAGITVAGNPEFLGNVSLDGDVGIGSSPSNVLTVLATAGFSAPVTFYDDVVIGDAVTDSLGVHATSHFYFPVTCEDTVVVKGVFTVNTGGSIDCNGEASFSDDFEVSANSIKLHGPGSGATSIELGVSGGSLDAATVYCPIALTQDATVSAGLLFSGGGALGSGEEIPVNGHLALGTGSIRKRLLSVATSASVYVTSCDYIEQTAAAPSESTFTLKPDGAADGDMITVLNYNTTYAVSVTNDGAPIASIGVADGASDPSWAEYIYSSAASGWRLLRRKLP